MYLYLELNENKNTFIYDNIFSRSNNEYELGLLKINGLINIKNILINKSNQYFSYIKNEKGSETYYDIKISEGYYFFDELIAFIKKKINVSDKNFFTASIDDNVVKFIIQKGYAIDFNRNKSFNFGFDKIHITGTITSKRPINTIEKKAYLVCNLFEDTMLNNTKFNILYSFQGDLDEIDYEPINIAFHSVYHNMNKISLNIVDAENNILDCIVNITVNLVIKEANNKTIS